MHGEYVHHIGGVADNDAYVACIKSLRDGHTELQIIDKPEVTIYVTKPQFRNNTVKKESEVIEHLDGFKTRVNKVGETLYNAINNPGRFRPVHGRFASQNTQLSSPYVYGADIEYGVHMRMAYKKANGNRVPESFKVGHLDIETDVNGTNEIILITYMDDSGDTYVAISEQFFFGHTIDEVLKMWNQKTDEQGNPVHWSKEDVEKYKEASKNRKHIPEDGVSIDFQSKLNSKGLDAYLKTNPIRLHCQVFAKELDLIKWTFDNIHRCKPDFVTIWNMDYDIPFILERLIFRGVDPADVICHPSVPRQYRLCNYHEDKGKEGDHITDHWSWFHLTDYTRYIDGMCLYGRLRKAKPREPSYKLDAIGGKELGTGKLQFGPGLGHSEMQRFHPVEYTVYNVVDVLILRAMEAKNHDVTSLNNLTGASTADCFAHQSIQLKNSYYEYLQDKKRIPGSIAGRIDDPWDKWITNKGGAVLSPDLALFVAVPALTESDLCVRACRWVCDIDVSSEYPSAMQMINCTRETLLGCVLNIDNTKRRGIVDVSKVRLDPSLNPGLINYVPEDFFINAIYAESNALMIGKMFGLPDIDEIDGIIQKDYPQLVAV